MQFHKHSHNRIKNDHIIFHSYDNCILSLHNNAGAALGDFLWHKKSHSGDVALKLHRQLILVMKVALSLRQKKKQTV